MHYYHHPPLSRLCYLNFTTRLIRSVIIRVIYFSSVFRNKLLYSVTDSITVFRFVLLYSQCAVYKGKTNIFVVNIVIMHVKTNNVTDNGTTFSYLTRNPKTRSINDSTYDFDDEPTHRRIGSWGKLSDEHADGGGGGGGGDVARLGLTSTLVSSRSQSSPKPRRRRRRFRASVVGRGPFYAA